MSNVIHFLREHLHNHWGHLGQAQLSQPALAFLALMEKAERGSPDAAVGDRAGAEP